ncbi:MAG: hypothetical protein R3F30_12585 [Planctomycetota bacterium]
MTTTPEHAFLGEEFLTWLWYRSESGQATFTTDQGGAVAVAFDDLLVFGGEDENRMQQTLRRGLPTLSLEAKAALQAGKRLRKARLVLADGPEQWSFTLDGATLAFGSVRCPDPDGDDDEAAPTPAELDCARMDGFARLARRLDGVYRLFLDERLSDDWERASVPSLRRWIDEKRGERV